MTREQAREAAKVMIAWADGKEVQYTSRYYDCWNDVEEGTEPLWDWFNYIYRLKPTATLRPWTADEVPLGAWIRVKTDPSHRSIIASTSTEMARNEWLRGYEHSTDGGLTWKPCGVEEVGK